MSLKTQRALACSIQTIEQNRPLIEKMLRESGDAVSDELVFTAAKYFDALNKLANE